ncbi:unnamed protein product [Gadus morhua 'NCC']
MEEQHTGGNSRERHPRSAQPRDNQTSTNPTDGRAGEQPGRGADRQQRQCQNVPFLLVDAGLPPLTLLRALCHAERADLTGTHIAQIVSIRAARDVSTKRQPHSAHHLNSTTLTES